MTKIEHTETKSRHTEIGAISSLSRKKDIRIKSLEILILSNSSKDKSHDIGNKSWGKISYLVNHCGYRAFFVRSF